MENRSPTPVKLALLVMLGSNKREPPIFARLLHFGTDSKLERLAITEFNAMPEAIKDAKIFPQYVGIHTY